MDDMLIITTKKQLQDAMREVLLEITQGFQQDSLNNVYKTHKKTGRKKKSEQVRSFIWISKDIDIDKLRTTLLKWDIIEVDDPMQFVKAFSGKPLEEESLYVVWRPEKSKKPNKVELFYFLEILHRRGLIQNPIPEEKHATILYDQLSHIFIDRDGSPIKNFRQSFLTFKKRRKNEVITLEFKRKASQGKRDEQKTFQNKVRDLLATENPGVVSSSVKQLQKMMEQDEDAYVEKYTAILSEITNK